MKYREIAKIALSAFNYRTDKTKLKIRKARKMKGESLSYGRQKARWRAKKLGELRHYLCFLHSTTHLGRALFLECAYVCILRQAIRSFLLLKLQLLSFISQLANIANCWLFYKLNTTLRFQLQLYYYCIKQKISKQTT